MRFLPLILLIATSLSAHNAQPAPRLEDCGPAIVDAIFEAYALNPTDSILPESFIQNLIAGRGPQTLPQRRMQSDLEILRTVTHSPLFSFVLAAELKARGISGKALKAADGGILRFSDAVLESLVNGITLGLSIEIKLPEIRRERAIAFLAEGEDANILFARQGRRLGITGLEFAYLATEWRRITALSYDLVKLAVIRRLVDPTSNNSGMLSAVGRSRFRNWISGWRLAPRAKFLKLNQTASGMRYDTDELLALLSNGTAANREVIFTLVIPRLDKAQVEQLLGKIRLFEGIPGVRERLQRSQQPAG